MLRRTGSTVIALPLQAHLTRDRLYAGGLLGDQLVAVGLLVLPAPATGPRFAPLDSARLTVTQRGLRVSETKQNALHLCVYTCAPTLVHAFVVMDELE